MIFSNDTYDKLKLVALLIVPLGTLVASLCSIWQWPYAEQITATAAAVDLFLGALIKISADAYHKEAGNG